MPNLTPEGRKLVDDMVQRHGFSRDAVVHMVEALERGDCRQAQFDHPDLGGMGQWAEGGMTMIGDMFNHGLKARVDALARDLSDAMRQTSPFERGPFARPRGASHPAQGAAGGSAWPEALGTPGSTGSQNDMHYAVFPESRRLAVRQGGRLRVFDTGEHHITGFAQAQGGGQSLTLTSQHGTVRLEDLAEVDAPEASSGEAPPDHPAPAGHRPHHDETFAAIERLHQLHEKGVLTAEEYARKKAELLDRL